MEQVPSLSNQLVDSGGVALMAVVVAEVIVDVVTFCVSRRRRKMYCGHARLCVCLMCLSVCLSLCLCVCLSAAIRPHYCTDPDVTWGRGRGCP